MKKLPEGWKIKPVKEFAEVITGGTPSTMKKEYWENGTVPWLPSGDLKNKPIKEAHIFITEAGLKNSAAKLMPKKTVVIALTGATTGQIGILELEASANQSVTGILPSKEHIPEYLFYYMRTAREKILNESYGAAQPHISQGYVKDFEVMLPPLPIQQKIISILEKAEQAKEMRKEADYLTSILLDNVFLEMFGDPIKNSKSWNTVELKSISQFNSGKAWKNEELRPSGMKIVRISNLHKTDFPYWHYSGEVTEKHLVKKGDLLFSWAGVEKSIDAYIYDGEDALLNQHIFNIIIIDKSFQKLFIYFILRLHLDYFRARLGGGVGQFHMQKRDIEEVKIINPPNDQKNKFVSIVKEVEAMKSQQNHSKEQIDNLFNALMQKAFKGGLL